MPAPTKAGHEGWSLGPRSPPGLKELTIELGDSDIYVNMSRRIELDNGHMLYEAVLTDPTGSRAIYIDRDDIMECLNESFFVTPPPDGAVEASRPGRPRRESTP